MFRNHDVAVVVPAFNEEGLVTEVIETIPSYVDRVYAVDDASTDRTWNDLQAITDGDDDITPHRWDTALPAQLDARVSETNRGGRVVALRHARNRGAGGAVKTGYLAALSEGFDLVATIDGDGQMDPTLLDRFLDPLVDGTGAYAKGSRFERNADLEEMPPFRQFGNTVLTHLSRAVTGYWEMSDPVNGYTAITRRALQRIDVADLYEGYGYGVAVLGRLNVAQLPVVDIPHRSIYAEETSSIRYHTYVPRVSRLLLVSAYQRLRHQRSMQGAGPGPRTLGLLLVALVVVGTSGWASKLRDGIRFPAREPSVEDEPETA